MSRTSVILAVLMVVGSLLPRAEAGQRLSAGRYHTCGVLATGAVKCWGDNSEGQSTPPAGVFRSVSAGAGHMCGVLESGAVKCWGFDVDGQSRPPSGVFRSVSAGGNHTCGVLESGAVKCWGRNKDLYGKKTVGQATPPPGIRIAAD